jgi:acyl-CoA synthetase (AMP-forming)/AMP-acid ligase II
VLISKTDLLNRARAEVDWFGLRPDDVLLNILPFSFDVGLNQLFSAMISGCSLAILDSWLPPDILRAAASYKVSGISAVPAIWQDMLAAGMKFDTNLAHQSLRYITVSGGDMPPSQLELLPQMAGSAGIFKTYGQSEAFRATSLRPEEFAAQKRSVGKPFTGVRVYVVREDNSLCAPLEQGQIIHSGLGLMQGYADSRDPENKLRPNPFFGPSDPSRMCIYTGDAGYFDEAGYLYVTGRRDGMLKIAGNRVYPQEIVEQLLKIENVSQAEVIATNSAQGTTHLVGIVVANNGATLQPMQLKRSAARLLPSFMAPQDFIVLREMPRTASGKIDRLALMEVVKGNQNGALV